jgi:guanylate kinase
VIIVVSGPGGAGKGTVVSAWRERDPKLYVNRSWTTRERRPGEAEDAYVFATWDEFQRRIDEGGFLEWVDFLDYRQGSPVPDPPDGHDVIFEIDVYGAKAVKEKFPDALTIYLEAPSREVQRQRLVHRGDSAERVEQRVARADQEAAAAADLECIVVINHEVEDTVDQLIELVEQHRPAHEPK